MPRRRALTEAQLDHLLALPTSEADLIRHWTLNAADLTAVERRRGDHNQLGYALQLCAFRYPGRLLLAALLAAKEGDADLDGTVTSAVGWEKLAASVDEAERLVRPDKVDLPALATRAWPVLHRLGQVFLNAFQLRAVPAAAATPRAVALLHEVYGSSGRKWPKILPTSFLRPAWRDAVRASGGEASIGYRRIWEAATLLALRDRLRAGDIWVEGSRQWRAIEDQLIPPALFATMRAAGPLPVAVPATAEEHLAERRALLERRMREINAKAAADTLEDIRIKGCELTITPLKAITPEEAHLHTGMPADDPRVVLTAVLADATNPGLTRMADVCSVASYRKLAWTAGWHLREDTYRQSLGHPGQCPAAPATRRPVRRPRRVQFRWSGLPDRRTR